MYHRKSLAIPLLKKRRFACAEKGNKAQHITFSLPVLTRNRTDESTKGIMCREGEALLFYHNHRHPHWSTAGRRPLQAVSNYPTIIVLRQLTPSYACRFPIFVASPNSLPFSTVLTFLYHPFSNCNKQPVIYPKHYMPCRVPFF